MNTLILIIATYIFSTFLCWGQTRIPYDNQIQDSICMFGEKYHRPERTTINFPETKVTEEYKISEIHKAIPDSLNNEDNEKWWIYDYYFVSKLTDYAPKGDSTFTPTQDNFLYKLKDTYFFDINGDGLLDFIHYPKYYMAIMRDMDVYELFIQNKNGYKWLTFKGFITDIEFNKDGTLHKMKTYQGPCCDDSQCTFFYYLFDKFKSELTLVKTEQILICQLK